MLAHLQAYDHLNKIAYLRVKFSMFIKCNPKEIVDTHVLVDITGCMLSVEPLCHDEDGALINEDGSPIFWELLATHLSVPMRKITRDEIIKDGSILEITGSVPVTSKRLCIFYTREDGYEALKRIESEIKDGGLFVDLSES